MLKDQLGAQRQKSAANYGPEGMAVINGAIEELHATGTAGARSVGDRAPLFTLQSARGNDIALGDLLGRSAVVLVFYRGGW